MSFTEIELEGGQMESEDGEFKLGNVYEVTKWLF